MSTQPTDYGQRAVPAVPPNGFAPKSSVLDSLIVTTTAITATLPQMVPDATAASDNTFKALPIGFLTEEEDFYTQYSWCINAFPRLNEVADRLASELNKFDRVEGWQYSEVATNIFLLSCAITDTVDDYLLGTVFDFSKLAKVLPLAGPGIRIVHKGLAWRSSARLLFLANLRRWRQAWADVVTDFTQHA